MFIFVVKPLGTCRGWGSSRSVALLSAPPEAQCAAPGGPHPVAPHGAGAEGGEGTGMCVVILPVILMMLDEHHSLTPILMSREPGKR
ncbi:unnamed protein product [Pleuronectes platessa]|uniref:Uncharacterized protein n=1 Tax=Pleuronectes platessa TaxID=8262 RepID=A0A9N7UY81_PLEPL|nr:unnamed protein product [Pleuronectes platessa]